MLVIALIKETHTDSSKYLLSIITSINIVRPFLLFSNFYHYVH